MSSGQNQKLNPEQSISFEDVSKLFSLPLSEAADTLGVSTSVLKRICNENGLERWPHRKYLAGKSIEEIKKEAIKESKALGGNNISQADGQKSNITTSSSSSPVSHHVKDKTPMSKSQSNTWRSQSHHTLVSWSPIETSTCLDEFKYGFPSSGLSRSINQWWGSDRDRDRDHDRDYHDGLSELDGNTLSNDMQDKVPLSTVRKRALDEGRKALKLGVVEEVGVNKLRKEEMILLRRLFQTS